MKRKLVRVLRMLVLFIFRPKLFWTSIYTKQCRAWWFFMWSHVVLWLSWFSVWYKILIILKHLMKVLRILCVSFPFLIRKKGIKTLGGITTEIFNKYPDYVISKTTVTVQSVNLKLPFIIFQLKGNIISSLYIYLIKINIVWKT